MALRVSVVIPAYRRLEFLPQAIESVLAQSVIDLEVVVSDNASDTDIRGVVSRYNDTRLRYRRNPVNVGLAGNLSAAIATTTGPLVAILSDDDSWAPDFLATLVAPLEADERLALAFCDHWIMDAAGKVDRVATENATRVWGRDRLPEGTLPRWIRSAIADKSIPVAVATVFRRDAVPWEQIPLESGSNCDYWLAYQAVRTGRPAWYTSRRMAAYRVHPASETARLSRFARMTADRQNLFILRSMLGDPAVSEVHGVLADRLRASRLRIGMLELRSGHLLSAARTLLGRMILPHVKSNAPDGQRG